MNLGIKEMVRNKARFGAVLTAVTLVNVLLLFLVSQLDGLTGGQTGAIRALDADIIVFSDDAERSPLRSNLSLDAAEEIGDIEGVASVGRVGVVFGAARVAGEDIDAAVIGFTPGAAGSPTTLVEGRLPGDPARDVVEVAVDEAAGLDIGEEVDIVGSEVDPTVVGIVSDSRLQLAASVWFPFSTWERVRDELRPELAGGDMTPGLVAVAVDTDFAGSLASLNRRIDDVAGVDSLPADEAWQELAGVKEQRQTFVLLLSLAYLAAGVVLSLFFALITLEKQSLIGVLRAVGATTGNLVSAVTTQGLVIAATGFVLAAVITLVAGTALPDAIPFAPSARAWSVVGAITITVGILGALTSLRRLARIDPADAIG